MKRFSRRLMFGAAVLLVAGPAAAQDNHTDKYPREARAHRAMAVGYIGNPNHPLDASMAVHCKALADQAAARAERARKGGWVEEAATTAPVVHVVGRTPSPSH